MRYDAISIGLLLASLWYTAPLHAEDLLDHQTAAYEFKPQRGEPVAAVLGSFSVRENRRADSTRRITLKYVKLPATGKAAPGAPIVYLAGGPGGSGVAAGRGPRYEMFRELRQLGDVILFDQRGTGISNSLPTGASWKIPLDTAATREVYEQVALHTLQESLKIWKEAGVDLEAYNTESNADDLADLCTVLGAEKVRIVGISYGTHLGLSFMRRHPDRLERIVLAGVEGPDHTLKMPCDQQALLGQIQEWIDQEPNTRAAYPDFLTSVERVLAQLEAEPHVIETSSTKIVITAFDVQHFLAALLRGPETFARAPVMIRAMEQGQFGLMPFALSQLRSGRFDAMSTAMDVASGATRERQAKIARQREHAMLADAINFPMAAIMRELPELDLGDDFRAPVVSDIPTLAISGTADGRTPPGNAEEVLRTLSHGEHLLIHGAGHSDPLFLSSPKIVEAMISFFRGEPLAYHEIHLPPLKFPTPPR